MPCNDITEVLTLRLDNADCILAYSLHKRTCGAEIGQANLLQSMMLGQNMTHLLGLTGIDLRQAYPNMLGETDEFLYAKHLVALQETARVILGQQPGRPNDPCTVVRIDADPNSLEVQALIRVEALTDNIRACNNCGSCPSR